MEVLPALAPIACLCFVWLARPTWKRGLVISLVTVAAVGCSTLLIRDQTDRLTQGVQQELQGRRGFDKGQEFVLWAVHASVLRGLQSAAQRLMAVALSFAVILASIVFWARPKSTANGQGAGRRFPS